MVVPDLYFVASFENRFVNIVAIHPHWTKPRQLCDEVCFGVPFNLGNDSEYPPMIDRDDRIFPKREGLFFWIEISAVRGGDASMVEQTGLTCQ